MIQNFFHRIIERWLLSITQGLIEEARIAKQNGDFQAAIVLIGIAGAINKADGRKI